MAMTIYKGVLKLHDTASGLGWSITCHREHASPDDFLTAADAFMSALKPVMYLTARVLGLTVSDPDVPGSFTEYTEDDFINQHGSATGGMCPVAECIIAKGDEPSPFATNHAQWKLHGFDVSMLTGGGQLDQANSSIVALKAAAKVYLLNYRKDPTPLPTATPPGFGWPAVTPPTAFAEFALKGPYVRRLGSTFFVRGQFQHYKT